MTVSKKGKIFLDFDSTLANSIKAICHAFSVIDGVKYDHSLVNTWNFHNVIPHANQKSVDAMFNSHLFWGNLELYNGVKEFIEEYKDRIIIVSIGSIENQTKKIPWIHKHIGRVSMLPVVTDMSIHPKTLNKTFIRMDENDIFVEDSDSHLNLSTAGLNILFSDRGFDCEWNSQCCVVHTKSNDWYNIRELVKEFDKKFEK